ncbi:MAG: DNA alkylation repair protein [bacterium]
MVVEVVKLANLERELRRLADPVRAKNNAWFFKTGPGQYGEGDKFIGLTVPKTRTVARAYRNLSFSDTAKLLSSPYHEARLCALLILVDNFAIAQKQRDQKKQTEIYNFYLKNLKFVNNWDLVDLSTPKIVGPYLLERSRSPLYKLVKSKNLWERRVAIIATCEFIRHKDFADTLKISELLLADKHDLIHKAVGWMLREVGKRDTKALENFLKKYYKVMPRTMLRYAIEKFPEHRRRAYLRGLI